MLIVITIISLILFFYKQHRLLVGLILSNYIFTIFLVTILKFLIEKPRNPLALIHENSYAFPSGHVAIATITFLLIYYLANFLKNNLWQNIFRIISILWLIIIMVDRLYLKVHDVYDVVGGIFIGIIVFYILINLKIFSRYKLKDELSKINLL